VRTPTGVALHVAHATDSELIIRLEKRQIGFTS